MDRRERFYDPEETLRAALDGLQARVWTATPGIIQTVDLVAMTASVQPAIRGVVSDENGAESTVALPLLLDCPLIYPTGGGFTLTFPIAPGDECLVLFSSRCIDAWWQQGGVQPQAEYRMHDLSDGFVLAGPRSQPRILSGVSDDSTQLRSDDGVSFVEVKNDTINVTTTALVHITAPDVQVDCTTAEVNATSSLTVTSPLSTFIGELVVTGTATVQGLFTYLAGLAGTGGGAGSTITGNLIQTGGTLSSEGTVLHTHTHSDPQGGNTGPPN